MAGFMNAELVKIRDNLVCGHCECKFVGSDSQARKVKYEACIVYCSSTCRHAMMRKKFSTPAPNRGPCKHCKKEFQYSIESTWELTKLPILPHGVNDFWQLLSPISHRVTILSYKPDQMHYCAAH